MKSYKRHSVRAFNSLPFNRHFSLTPLHNTPFFHCLPGIYELVPLSLPPPKPSSVHCFHGPTKQSICSYDMVFIHRVSPALVVWLNSHGWRVALHMTLMLIPLESTLKSCEGLRCPQRHMWNSSILHSLNKKVDNGDVQNFGCCGLLIYRPQRTKRLSV